MGDNSANCQKMLLPRKRKSFLTSGPKMTIIRSEGVVIDIGSVKQKLHLHRDTHNVIMKIVHRCFICHIKVLKTALFTFIMCVTIMHKCSLISLMMAWSWFCCSQVANIIFNFQNYLYETATK